MTEAYGNSAPIDEYTRRKDELLMTLPWDDPTAEQIEAAHLRLLQDVTFEDEAKAAACDDRTIMAARVLESSEAIRASARSEARFARVGSILEAEGLTPPVKE